MRVDVIEAGFPIASPDDFDAVQQIANIVGNEVDESGYVPVICGLSRANARDIECAWDAVKSAKLPRVHTFIATSKIHMETKLCKTLGLASKQKEQSFMLSNAVPEEPIGGQFRGVCHG